MTRVRFTCDDLARTRLIQAPAPLVETVLGIVALRRPPSCGHGSRWHRRALRAFPPTARPLLDLIPVAGYWPEFLDPVAADLDEGLEMVCATPRAVVRSQLTDALRHTRQAPCWLQDLADSKPEALQVVRRGLRDFHAACVTPYWPRILASFQSDLAQRTQVLAAGGLAELFGTLHEDLAWHGSSLERAWRTGEIQLGGRGLQLVPSTLWAGPPLFSVRPDDSGGNALIYPVQPAKLAWRDEGSEDLSLLLGRTRAGVLLALRTPCNTADLAVRLGVSASSASEHATVLRRAGLVQTTRHGRSVRHSLTPLGRGLLSGHTTSPESSER